MCGILGEFSIRGRLLDKERFLDLLHLSTNRGPDGSGHFCNGTSIQFGFNRLAILDLSDKGMQPMHSPSGRYTIVLNGEIYNHLQIRSVLVSGSRIESNNDAITVCYALDEWGIQRTIEKLDGMFAIGIFDNLESRLSLIRDFAGIKPLHYGLNDQYVVFASQYDQVCKHPVFHSQSIQPGVLKLYLEQHYVPDPFGIFHNTHQVRPGEIVDIDKTGALTKRNYWQFPANPRFEISSVQGALASIDEQLGRSVNEEMLSDVPVGAFLSGGIDSPLVCYYAQKDSVVPINAFTIGSDSEMHDESEDAAVYAALAGVKHVVSRMDSGEAAYYLDAAMGSLKEPFGDFSILPTYLVSKLAREKVTVALSGDGGDELFWGYERFASIAKNAGVMSFPKIMRYLIYGIERKVVKSGKINSGVLLSSLSSGHRSLHSRFRTAKLNGIFPDLASVRTPDEYNVYTYGNSTDPVKLLMEIRKSEFYGMMQKTLRKVDAASMENSLEVRVPFLKKSFIETALSIDPLVSYKADEKKYLLKRTLTRHLPGSPVNNVKRGFTVPLGDWMRQKLKGPFADVLLDKNMHATFGINSTKLVDLFDQHQSGQDNKWPLFTLYSLFRWKSKMSE